MAVLDVDEVEAGLRREHGRVDEEPGQLVQLAVAEKRFVVRTHAVVEDRMAIGGAWSRRTFGASEPSGMGELESGHLFLGEEAAETGDVVGAALVEHELVRVGPTVAPDRGRLAPHEPAAAGADP